MAYIATAINKPLSADAAEIYFELLGDLPADVLKVAAKRVLLEHPWSTFPSVAELRQAASETLRGSLTDLSASEAWAQAWKAVGRIDLDISGSAERALAKLPPLVVEAMRTMSIPAMVNGKEPVGVIRGQFLKVYEQLAAREKRLALLPGPVKQSIAAIGEVRPEAQKVIADLGRIE